MIFRLLWLLCCFEASLQTTGGQHLSCKSTGNVTEWNCSTDFRWKLNVYCSTRMDWYVEIWINWRFSPCRRRKNSTALENTWPSESVEISIGTAMLTSWLLWRQWTNCWSRVTRKVLICLWKVSWKPFKSCWNRRSRPCRLWLLNR